MSPRRLESLSEIHEVLTLADVQFENLSINRTDSETAIDDAGTEQEVNFRVEVIPAVDGEGLKVNTSAHVLLGGADINVTVALLFASAEPIEEIKEPLLYEFLADNVIPEAVPFIREAVRTEAARFGLEAPPIFPFVGARSAPDPASFKPIGNS